METLAEMKRRNSHLYVIPFVGDSLNLDLAVTLGLSPAEVDQINAAYRTARQRLSDQALKTATSRISADGTKLIVSIPPFPTEADSPYSDLLNKVTQVLGPERFQVFNEVAGEAFDRDSDRFGLNAVTYELGLQPVGTATSPPSYSLRHSSVAADVKESSSASGTFTRADIEKFFPVLTHFLPPDSGTRAPAAASGN